jgi:predicted TIM-barrel fold metal-dependent hydrolase
MNSSEVRASLGHPVVDCDGHVQEYVPAALPYLRAALGPALFDRYLEQGSTLAKIMDGADAERRLRRRLPQSAWWATPARNTRDLATAVLPRLLTERMGELGIDYAVLYPTKAMGAASPDDADLRRGLCRGWNDFYADAYREFSRELTVAGIVPMHTPDEAIDELEHCRAIGLKVVAIPEGVYRPIDEPASGQASPFLMPGQTHWFDNFGLDSAYDYDPVWAAFERLGFAVTVHGGIGQIAPNNFTSISNYTFNHIGMMAEKMHRVVKSLFMAGTTRRFPKLSFAALECGVGWATTLVNDIVEHWEKRNPVALADLDPATIDWDELERLVRRYGDGLVPPGRDVAADLPSLPAVGAPPADLDEWRFVDAHDVDELVDLFASHFYFGCEADDRTLAVAFSEYNPRGRVLRPVFSSDIGHWDVPDMAETLAEAWELVEDGLIDADNFRDFVFTNPVRLLTAVNPSFFDGTAIEAAAGAKGVRTG